LYTYNFKLNKGDQNVGTVYLPDSNCTGMPTIIYCHGWGDSRWLNPSTKALLEKALENNMAFVTFDNYGCGETGGDYSMMTYKRWAKCTEDVFDWVAEQNFSDDTRIGCFSISSGTTAAIRFAQNTEKPAFVISVATAISTHIGMGAGGPCKVMMENLETLLSGGTAELFGVQFYMEFFRDEIKNAAIYSMDKIKCPVFFLQGANDNQWRIADAKFGYNLMLNSGKNTKHFEVEGGDHSLNERPEICAEKSIQWIRDLKII
jgi:pimeloyl-ACP methyl ester carboxylesterase